MNLFSLERRKLRGDLIQVSSIGGHNKGNVNKILTISDQNRKGNNVLNLEKRGLIKKQEAISSQIEWQMSGTD